MAKWENTLELNDQRECISGSSDALCDAIRRGADLRIGTAFRYNEHLDTSSSNTELVHERMDFRVTYLIEDRWTAGIETLRMPVNLPHGFGPRASMSFFVYNQDGNQAIGRPYLDGKGGNVPSAAARPDDDAAMPKNHSISRADEGANAPSEHFIYDFEYYRYLVCDRWREVLSHDEEGQVVSGSLDALTDAVNQGSEVKLGIRGLCDDLGDALEHEVFVHVGPCYYLTEMGLLVGAANPLVRVLPTVPLIYQSKAWDFGWLLGRTDGNTSRWLCDPQTLQFSKSESKNAIRWFVEDNAD